MTLNYIIGYLVAAVLVMPTGAWIAQFVTARIGGFRTGYKRALLSTILAYVAVNLFGVVLFFTGQLKGSARGLLFLIGLAILTGFHVNILRSETGQHLSPGKAFVVALCQILGAGIALFLFLLILLGLKRLFF